MSDPAVNASTLRLLAPRALAGADRLAQSLSTPPLARSQPRGPLAFSDRMLRSWVGTPDRPASSPASRVPSAAALPAPSYELPAQPEANAGRSPTPAVTALPPTQPAMELRAIDLVRDTLVRDEFVQRLDTPNSNISLTQQLVAQLGRVDEMLRLNRALPQPARPDSRDQGPAPLRSQRLALAALRTDAGAAMATGSVAPPSDGAQAGRGQDALTSRAFVAVTPPAGATAVGRASGFPAQVAPPATAGRAVALESETVTREPGAMTREVSRTPLGAALEAQLVVAAREADVLAAMQSASVVDVPAPRAVPGADSAGVPHGTTAPAAVLTRQPGASSASPSQGAGPDFARHSFAGPALGPIGLGSLTDAGGVALPSGFGVQAELPPGAPTVWPRLQRFIERLAGPVLLQQTGAVAVDALSSAAASRAGAMSVLELTAGTHRARAPGDVTLAGELVRYEASSAAAASPAAGARFMPGRLAQRAELLATLAEQRADRQLGLEPAVAPRAVSWSSDAFTVVTLDPWGSPVGGRASGGSLVATAPSARVADALSLDVPGHFAPAQTRANAAEGDRPSLRRAGFEPAFVAPERWTTGRGVEHTAPRREVDSLPSSYADVPSRDAALGASVAPGSIAALLAFADAQLGPRLLEAARPLPVDAPGGVSLASSAATRALATRSTGAGQAFASADGIAVAGLSDAEGAGPSALTPSLQREFVRRYVELTSARPTTLDLSASFSLGAAQSGRTAPSGSSSHLRVDDGHGHGGMGQLGRRSEQVAGEVGVRVGALASEFLIDVPGDGQSSDPGSTMHARDAARPWLSTSEWILLSLFPSTAMAHQIAAGGSVASRTDVARNFVDGGGRFPLAAVGGALTARAAQVRPSGSFALGTAREASILGRAAYAATLATFEGEEVGPGLAGRAPALAALTLSSAGYEERRGDSSAAVTAFLPDGRMPRGNRMVARTAMPTIGGAPLSLVHTSEAAERRAAAPVGAPLWGQLRQMVERGVGGPPTPRASPGLVSLHSAQHGPRSTALELVTPFIEASRAETTGGAASFNRAVSPVVRARAPDQPTKSLVTALSAAASQPSNDRLTMADLTLISIVSATEQVAASTQGTAPDLAPANARHKPGSSHANEAGFTTNNDHEIELIAERAFERLMDELRRYTEHKGDTWEK